MTPDSSRGQQQSFDILLIEAHSDDISPVIDSFEATDVTNEVHVVSDGDQALDFIHQRGDYTDVPRPDLILLDLHLPGGTVTKFSRNLTRSPSFNVSQ